jgi:putative heme-binding domain-containing protein
VIGALLERRDWTPRLLDAVGKGDLEIAAIDVAARARLLEHSDSSVAKRARQLLGTQTGDRAVVVAAHRDVLTMAGDPERGKHVFDENCARCHMPRSQGGRVGPDLSGVNNKTKEELLTSILNPSYAIESRYVNYVVTTQDGRMLDGVIVSETPGSITLRGGTAEEDISVLRGNIAEVRASSISLMPDELEKSVNRQGLADVIAYLRSGL